MATKDGPARPAKRAGPTPKDIPMIDNTFEVADGPLCATLQEALTAPGALYMHVKKGGIYRRIGHIKWAGDLAAEELAGVPISIYEHIWPHRHSFFGRPDAEFVEIVRTDKGEHRRFEFIPNAVIVGSEPIDA